MSKPKSTITIKLIKSTISTKPNHRAIIKALGLKKISQTRQVANVPSLRGMIKKVIHLLEVTE